MSVLLLSGKPVDWADPPKATDKVMWSQRTTGGKKVIGSLRTIAHLDHLSALAIKRYRVGVSVIQPPFNTGVVASEGTHDFDACSDVEIVGVPWDEQNRFFRANGFYGWVRQPPAFSWHYHGFTLPPVAVGSVSERFRKAGFMVGKYVDGGWSLFGRVIGSSQIQDAYTGRTGLSGHAIDPTWRPDNLDATIFDLGAYIGKQRRAAKAKTLNVALINIPAKIGRAAIADCWKKAAARGAVFGVNESFDARTRSIYRDLVGQTKGAVGVFGLDRTPNPVFWRTNRLRLLSGTVHRIHPKNTTAPNAAKWPGFYDARFITECVFVDRLNKVEVAVLNTHLAAEVKVIDQQWLKSVKRESRQMLRNMVRTHQSKGRVVVVMGDTNDREDFSMPRGFKWYTKGIIDKIGGNRAGSSTLFVAPTDHKHGVRASIRL